MKMVFVDVCPLKSSDSQPQMIKHKLLNLIPFFKYMFDTPIIFALLNSGDLIYKGMMEGTYPFKVINVELKHF